MDEKDLKPKPNRLSRFEMLEQLSIVEQPIFEKVLGPLKNRKHLASHLHWTKKSIFSQLPYWKTLTVRHNLDVMHIEKNVCDNVVGTLMNIDGKTKDTYEARLDLEWISIRKNCTQYVTMEKFNCRMHVMCSTIWSE